MRILVLATMALGLAACSPPTATTQDAAPPEAGAPKQHIDPSRIFYNTPQRRRGFTPPGHFGSFRAEIPDRSRANGLIP